MSDMAVQQIDKHIQALELKLEHARIMRKMCVADPSFASDMLDTLLDPAANGTMNAARLKIADNRRRVSKWLPEMKAYFQSQGNGWRSAREIADGCGIEVGSVNYLLYTSAHRDLFEGKLVGPRHRVWRLKDPSADVPPADQLDPQVSNPPA